ncbi:MAG TPA: hypothetical protein VKQ36_06800 [Ktedonobacterales bacterium]|nr:hypothetical protein [Ktedonobacterales bacterium]
MSGPGRTTTRRDQRRLTRREQYEQRRLARERERQRKLRNQRIQRYSLIGGGIAAALVVIVLLSVFVFHLGSSTSPRASTTPTVVPTFPAVSSAVTNAQTIDGMACATTLTSGQSSHIYLKIYVNGQQMQVPADVGVSVGKSCVYPITVPVGEPNVIHVETSSATQVYTLGNFFDLWGQPLSKTQVGSYKANSSHKLVFEVFDSSGKLTTITTDPRQIQLLDHETVVILYNSPNVHPTAFTSWNSLAS